MNRYKDGFTILPADKEISDPWFLEHDLEHLPWFLKLMRNHRQNKSQVPLFEERGTRRLYIAAHMKQSAYALSKPGPKPWIKLLTNIIYSN